MDNSDFPPLYHTEDYAECVGGGKKFCMVVANLNDNVNSTWERLTSDELFWKLNRRYVHRGICLPRGGGTEESLITQVTNILSRQLYSQNVTVDDIYCQREISPMSAIDKTFLWMVFTVFMFVTVGTFLDCKDTKYKNTFVFAENVLVKFSLKKNWKNITQTKGSGDYNRLKSIQGVRVIANIGIICIHVGMTLPTLFYHNPEVLEKIFRSRLYQVASTLSAFAVHIFLVISSFLFSNQVYSQYEKNGSMTLRDLLILIINRYFRLYIPTIVFIIFSHVSIFDRFLGIPSMKMFNMNRRSCQENWGATMLFSHNFLKVKDMGHHIVWFALFFGLPAFAVFLSSFKYNRILTAILGSMVKVIFTTGIAIGIIGMSQGLGGKIRKYFEGQYNLFLGNISFSVYLFNFTVMLLTNGGGSELKTLDIYLGVRTLVKDISLSILTGLLLSLIIEQPAVAIQKMILPQLSNNTAQLKKNE